MNEKLESEVKFYCRLFPELFSRAKGSFIYNQKGEKFLDFFCGSGSLNYGHNSPDMKMAILDYINEDGILNSLDQLTEAKLAFMADFKKNILSPRNMEYKMQFCGPTGTNSVEAAIKLARKYTMREKVIFFENSFHGMTYGAMSVSGMKSSSLHKDYLQNTIGVPFEDADPTLEVLRDVLSKMKKDEIPAAIILETLQAEGGMKLASSKWLETVQSIAKAYGILLIIDDIQAGCGRTGNFFSFEGAAIDPDIICLSKSLSGFGLPFSMNLIKESIDCWKPGEHNGTFRGNNLAFVTGRVASEYWLTKEFGNEIEEKAMFIEHTVDTEAAFHHIQLKGKGLMRGLEFESSELALLVQKQFFKNKILVDICGPLNNVVKLMPPLNISLMDLKMGMVKITDVLERLKHRKNV